MSDAGYMRGLPVALVVGVVASACSGAGSQAVVSPAPSPSAPARLAASPAATPPLAATPTAPPAGAAPVSSGAVADAGVLYVWGADDGIYRYDGATGALARVWGASALAHETANGPYVLGRHGGINLLRWDGTTEWACRTGSYADVSVRGTCAFQGVGGDAAVYVDRDNGAELLLPADWGATSFVWSPDGAELAIVRSEARPEPVRWHQTLWHLDRRGALTKIFDSGNGTSFLLGLKWSFDRRLAFRELATLSNSLAADGVGTSLHVVNVDTGVEVDLGTTLGARAWAQWSVDGRLAFVSGGGRETWANKQLVVLEPDGTRRVVAGDIARIRDGSSVAIAPAWQPSLGTPARLAWIASPAGDSPGLDYVNGVGPTAQRVAVLEAPTGRTSLGCPNLITEGVRWSADANAALLLCREPGVGPHPLQIWYAPIGGIPHALVTSLGNGGFGYYGLQPSLFDIVAWSLADR